MENPTAIPAATHNIHNKDLKLYEKYIILNDLINNLATSLLTKKISTHK